MECRKVRLPFHLKIFSIQLWAQHTVCKEESLCTLASAAIQLCPHQNILGSGHSRLAVNCDLKIFKPVLSFHLATKPGAEKSSGSLHWPNIIRFLRNQLIIDMCKASLYLAWSLQFCGSLLL